MHNKLVSFIREVFPGKDSVPLTEPIFSGNENQYLNSAIDSTFVSSAGQHVNQFEAQICEYTKSPFAVATASGTSALHIALLVAGVTAGDLVITQALTFVATCNTIAYCGADPVFVDVDPITLGLSAVALKAWLEEHCFIDDTETCRHKNSLRIIRACVPMHSFGFPVDMDEIMAICQVWRLRVIEDAAESLGSKRQSQATGTFAPLGILSFNGNKIITSGGGGMLLAKTLADAERAKHLTTTGKSLQGYAMFHNEIAYNYRMPNLNAALGLAQLENIETFVQRKRMLAESYRSFLSQISLKLIQEPAHCRANYWLITALCEDQGQRDALLNATNQQGVMTRPAWTLMHRLPMYQHCLRDHLNHSCDLQARIINLPS